MNIAEFRALIQSQSNTLLEKPVSFPFKGDDDSMVPKGKEISEIVVNPLKVGTVNKIVPLISKINDEDLEKITANSDRDFDPGAPVIFKKYGQIIIDIIWISLHNKKTEPVKWFREFLEANCTWNDLHVFLNAILYRLGTANFYQSIILSEKMSPMDVKEIIAFTTCTN